MTVSNGSVIYGKQNIPFEVIYVERKTMEISVMPDASVVIKAPLETSHEEIEKRVKKRARWICKQINYFRQFEPRTPPRQYLSGETHLYLGKQYRLKIITASCNSVKLQRGYIIIGVTKNKPEVIKKLLKQWYSDKAHIKFDESFNRCWDTFGNYSGKKPDIYIRQMKSRWGSLSKKGTLTLNVDLVRAPVECVEYVITHELCHLKHNDHSRRFYELLEKVMPDWENRKHKLELSLV